MSSWLWLIVVVWAVAVGFTAGAFFNESTHDDDPVPVDWDREFAKLQRGACA